MDDINKLMSEYAADRQAQAGLNERNKERVFDTLAEAGITAVYVDFDGEGDSGQINNVIAFRGEERAEFPQASVTVERVSYRSAQPSFSECTIEEAIETLCYGYLEEAHGGWENNDGAYGKFRFDVVRLAIELEFNGRFTDIFTQNHSF